MRDAAELFPKFAFFVCNLLRQLNVDDHVEVALPPVGACGQATPAHAKLPPMICASRDANRHSILERRHNHTCTQHGFPWRQVEPVIQIGAAYSELRVRGKAYAQIQITGRATTDAVLTHACNADSLTFMYPGWNSNLQSLRFCFTGMSVGALQRKGACHPGHGLSNRTQNIPPGIGPTLGKPASSTDPARGRIGSLTPSNRR